MCYNMICVPEKLYILKNLKPKTIEFMRKIGRLLQMYSTLLPCSDKISSNVGKNISIVKAPLALAPG